MTVENQFPYQSFTANGLQTNFTLGFYVDDKNHFEVKKNDLVVTKNDYSYDSGSNSIVFNTAPKQGDVIEVQRSTIADRATTYATYNNSFRPEVLNKDIDRIWLKIQELGVADQLLKIYTDRLHIEQKSYIDNEAQAIKNIVNDLRNYLNQQDNNRNTYFESLIRQQGTSLEQLEQYYQYLLQSIAKIVSEKGWESSFIAHEGQLLQEVLNNQKNKIASTKDNGGIDNEDIASSLKQAFSKSKFVLLNNNGISRQFLHTDNNTKLFSYGASLKQVDPNKHTICIGYAKNSAGALANIYPENITVEGIQFGSMPDATADDFAAVNLSNTHNSKIIFNNFKQTENAVTAGTTNETWAVQGEGSKDTLILGNQMVSTNRFAVQNIQASYSRIIGNSAKNEDGNNETLITGAINNGGRNGGIRLAGLAKGNIVALNSVRDKSTGLDFQRGNFYNVAVGNYFENTYNNSINVSSSNLPIGGHHIIDSSLIHRPDGTAVRMAYLSLSNFSGSIFKTSNKNSAGYGVDAFPTEANTEMFAIDFEGGSGTVPEAGSTLTQSSVTCKVVAVHDAKVQLISAGSAMPTIGKITVKNVANGNLRDNIAIDELSVIVKEVHALEGRNRIDAIASKTANSSLRVGTNSNIATFISNYCKEADLDLSGQLNIVDVSVSERTIGKYSIVRGNNNIIRIVDNGTVNTDISLLVSGSNNIIFANTKVKISVSGENNTLVVDCHRLSLTGSNNIVYGRCNYLDNLGNNNFSAMQRGKTKGTITATTDANGLVFISHGLITLASYFDASLVNSSELMHVTVDNVAQSYSRSTVKVWKANGEVAANKQVTIQYVAEV